MIRYITLYLSCAAVFFGLDFIWLTTSVDAIYRPALGDMLLAEPNLAVAAGFYLVYVAGVVILAAAPAGTRIGKALLLGAVFGFVAYGTYDLTNLATLRGFAPNLVVIDMIWGTFLTAVASGAGVFITSRLIKP